MKKAVMLGLVLMGLMVSTAAQQGPFGRGPGGGQGAVGEGGWAGGPQAGMPCDGDGPALEAAETWTDAVKSINVGEGLRHPSIQFEGGRTVMVGPNRQWVTTEFQVDEGEIIEVTAFPSSRDPQVWVALKIVNSSGEELVLRDETGRPLSGRGLRGRMQKRGPRN